MVLTDKGLSLSSERIPATWEGVLSQERCRLLLEQTTEYALFLVDDQGRIASWNVGAQRMTGYTAEEAIGQPIAILFTPEDRSAKVPEGTLACASARGCAEETRWRQCKDGTRFWGSSILERLKNTPCGFQGFVKILQHRAYAPIPDREAERNERIAETLQRSLLIKPPPGAFPGLEIGTHYEAAGSEAEIGGDFFDAFSFWDDRVAIVVGDVLGKGLEAAAYTAQAKYALRAFLQEYDGNPGATLTRLNAFLLAMREGGRGSVAAELSQMQKARDGVDILISLALLVIDTETGRVEYALAGAEPPLVMRSPGPKTEEMIISGIGGTFLGVAADVQYRTNVFSLCPGDLLLLTTDGITEARHRGPERLAFFGLEGAAQAVRDHADSGLLPGRMERVDMSNACRAVADAARAFAGGMIQDDVCLLLLRYTAAA